MSYTHGFASGYWLDGCYRPDRGGGPLCDFDWSWAVLDVEPQEVPNG